MSFKKSGIDWAEIGEEENLVIFSVYEPTHRLTFVKYLGNVVRQINEKDVLEHRFNVEDLDVLRGDNKKILPVISKRLLRKLKEHEPLIGKSLEIRKAGKGFDTNYLLKPINISK